MLSFSATAQNSEKLTELINSKTATYGQVAYLYGVYSEKIDENASYEESFDVLKENFPLKKEISSSSPVTLAELSFICAKLADLKGGIFLYAFFKSTLRLQGTSGQRNFARKLGSVAKSKRPGRNCNF